MRLKVVVRGRLNNEKSTATPEVEIVNAETGERLDWIYRVNFTCEAGEVPMLRLETYDFDVDYEGEGIVGTSKPVHPSGPPESGVMDVTPLGYEHRVPWHNKRPGPPEVPEQYRHKLIPKASE